jgi:uncharacterized 2Fe-2S/4Fe-4S cluster protein (DUF4445 family)
MILGMFPDCDLKGSMVGNAAGDGASCPLNQDKRAEADEVPAGEYIELTIEGDFQKEL